MLQLVYVSSVIRPPGTCDIDAIFEVSRRNNMRDGLTGMLYADQRRFLQAIEGPTTAVLTTLRRIERDPRHRALVILSQRPIAVREFGTWDMAHAAVGHDADTLTAQVAALVAGASATIQATFQGFVEARRST